MDELRPWSESKDEASRLVGLAASIEAAPVDLSRWDDVVRATKQRRDWRLVPAFAASLAAGIVLVLWLKPAPNVVVPTPEAPVLVASANATWQQQPSGVVRLDAGRLSVQRVTSGRVVLETPHATLDATRARFLAEVTAGGTTLIVQEGEVVLRTKTETRVVKAGETLVWPPTPTIPAPLSAVAAPSTSVCDEATGSRLDCLRVEAQGDGLTAQAALYELGVLELKQGNASDALAAWTTSLARFPEGVLHPEVRLALLVELTKARRFTEAVVVARAFEAVCSADPRLTDVQALRRSLEAR
ncbi:MAG: tetratricopeptide repeat protein [Myxococcales bacterium]|nr:tetratricopeptide repeat protein [Myxococcales bacterium]